MTAKLAAKNEKHNHYRGECLLLGEVRSDLSGARSVLNGDVRLVPLSKFTEYRGTLMPFDFETMPFRPKRVFIVSDVPAGTRRGQHAHRRGQQLLVRLAGEICVELRKGGYSETVSLARSDIGLLVPAGVWAAQTYVTSDSVLLVLCSERYDPTSYVYLKIA